MIFKMLPNLPNQSKSTNEFFTFFVLSQTNLIRTLKLFDCLFIGLFFFSHYKKLFFKLTIEFFENMFNIKGMLHYHTLQVKIFFHFNFINF